uniref:NADH:ubiquinone oxidoreductase complex assembly factor 3 n=1 Tax=Apteryx owenii TaxID=8824 RepID=A0A8B9SCF1_APTOW
MGIAVGLAGGSCGVAMRGGWQGVTVRLMGGQAWHCCGPCVAELLARRVPSRAHRLTPADDELYQRTRVTVLEPESPNIMFIEGYTGRGFAISGSLVVGPCAILPRAILQWNVGSYRDISQESLSLFRLLEPQIGMWGGGRPCPPCSPPERRCRGPAPPWGRRGGVLCLRWPKYHQPTFAPGCASCCRDPGAGHRRQGGAAASRRAQADAGVRDCCGGAGHGEEGRAQAAGSGEGAGAVGLCLPGDRQAWRVGVPLPHGEELSPARGRVWGLSVGRSSLALIPSLFLFHSRMHVQPSTS